MKLAFIFVLAALLGYSSGLMIEAMGEGEQSKLHILANTGKFNQDWIPFFIDGELSKIQNLEQNAGFERLDIPKFVQIGHLWVEEVSPIDSANVAFNIAIHPVMVNDKKSLQNVIDKCIFHSPDNFSPLCVICRLLDASGEVVLAEGIINLNVDYEGSNSIEINVFQDPPPANSNDPLSNDVQDVHGVEVTICRPNEGCTPGFWKNNFQAWDPTGLNPGDLFEDAFALTPDQASVIDNFFTPGFPGTFTLGDAIDAKSGGLNALVRHATASLLNQLSPDFQFLFSVIEIQTLVQDALQAVFDGDEDADSIIEATKDAFVTENERFCPIDASKQSEETGSKKPKKNK